MLPILARIINLLANTFVFIVIVDSILSYFLGPYHPLRNALDRIVEPFLNPIRRIVPMVGTLDLSPLVLIVLVEILSTALTSFLYAM